MAHAISVDAKTIDRILQHLDSLTKDMAQVKEKLFDEEPPEGSKAWWEWSERKADEDIKNGDVYVLKDEKELDNFFNNIYSDVSNEKYHNKVRA